jgi:RNA-binding protein 25
MNERKDEEELDKKDRQKEKEELEELCKRIVAEGHMDPEAEFQRVKAQRDAKYKPVLLVAAPRHVEKEAKKVPMAEVPNGDAGKDSRLDFQS